MVQLALCLCLKHYPAPLENPTTCFYFLSRWCTCSYQLHPLSLPPSLPPTPPPRHLSLQVWLQYPERTAPLSTLPRSPLRQSASLTRRTSWFGPASCFLPSHCVCAAAAAVVVAWCQPTPTGEEDISLPLLCQRAASNLPSLSSSPAPLASVPCQSTRLLPQPELSSNSSETSGRRRVLDSPSLRLLASAACYGN